MSVSRASGLAVLMAGLAIASLPPAADAATKAAPLFDPVAFFTGRTTGEGMLKQVFKAERTTTVQGNGHLSGDGTLVLDQSVAIEGDPVKTRRWQLRQIAPGRFQGTLTDASGPVTADVTGDTLQIRYTMKGGMAVQQQLTMAPGGQSARNIMKIRKFGLTVATLDETIRRR